jgi:hypothetical protein
MVKASGLGDEPRRVLSELSKINLVDVVLPTSADVEIRKRCITRPTEHQERGSVCRLGVADFQLGAVFALRFQGFPRFSLKWQCQSNTAFAGIPAQMPSFAPIVHFRQPNIALGNRIFSTISQKSQHFPQEHVHHQLANAPLSQCCA